MNRDPKVKRGRKLCGGHNFMFKARLEGAEAREVGSRLIKGSFVQLVEETGLF